MKNKSAALLVLVLGTLQLTFGLPADQKKSCMNTINSPNNDSTLTLIAKGDLLNWNGLPDDITVDDFHRLFTDTAQTDTVRLSGRPATKKRYSTPEQKQPLVVWIQNDSVSLVQLWMPEIKDPRLLIKNLGKPDMKIEAVKNAVIPMATQWVYGKRGITLYVNEFMKKGWSRTIPEGYIQAVSLYKPATAEYYRDYLGGADTRIRFPKK